MKWLNLIGVSIAYGQTHSQSDAISGEIIYRPAWSLAHRLWVILFWRFTFWVSRSFCSAPISRFHSWLIFWSTTFRSFFHRVSHRKLRALIAICPKTLCIPSVQLSCLYKVSAVKELVSFPGYNFVAPNWCMVCGAFGELWVGLLWNLNEFSFELHEIHSVFRKFRIALYKF